MARRSPINVPLSADALQSIWHACNLSYFRNGLPPVEIQWSARLTASVGLFVSRTGPRDARVSSEERHGAGRVIRLSAPLLSGQSVATIRSALAHEMIHQWQFDVKQCRPSHGREFRRIMDMMNADGLGIAMYHALTEAVEAFTKFVWRCGRCGHTYRRQRNTLSPKRHRCGECLGPLRHIAPPASCAQTRAEPAGRQATHGAPKRVRPLQLVLPFCP